VGSHFFQTCIGVQYMYAPAIVQICLRLICSTVVHRCLRSREPSFKSRHFLNAGPIAETVGATMAEAEPGSNVGPGASVSALLEPSEDGVGGADPLVMERVRVVLAIIADKASPERWDAVGRLRLFCEGVTSTEELEEIGSKSVPTMRTLVELLDELIGTLHSGSTETQVIIEDVVWLLVRAATRARCAASRGSSSACLTPRVHPRTHAARSRLRRNACSAA
jgi:hypothetical protein